MNTRWVLVPLIGGGLFCLWTIASSNLNPRESMLVGVILTMLSILSSWLVTHSYSESQHKRAIKDVQEFHKNNLQTYAKKAAEKVNNLSKELGKLASYLASELERSDSDDPNEMLLSREERMASCVHVINTLKSMNDTSLSDWEGVIDDLLEQTREEKEEQEEELYQLLQRLEPLFEDQAPQSSAITAAVRQEVSEIRKDIKLMAVNMGLAQAPRRAIKRNIKQDVLTPCPECKSPLKYRQRPKIQGFKSVQCPDCSTKFISLYSEKDDEFILSQRKITDESLRCSTCENTLIVPLDNLPSSSADVTCEKCKSHFRISRSRNGSVKVNMPSTPKPTKVISEEILESVLSALPPQPWPKGVHKEVADRLKISINMVRRAMFELTQQGKVNPQIDGVVYVPLLEERSQDKSQQTDLSDPE